MIVPADSPISGVYRQDEAPRFPVYRPTASQADRTTMARLSAEVQARVAEEDEALLAVEAQLPGGDDEIHWSELETESSEDDKYFPAVPASHDHKTGGSREPPPSSPVAATISESQVT